MVLLLDGADKKQMLFLIRLTLYALMDSSFWSDPINLGWPIVQMRITGYNIQIKLTFISFTELINSKDSDQMQHLHCLPKKYLSVTNLQRFYPPMSLSVCVFCFILYSTAVHLSYTNNSPITGLFVQLLSS